MPFLTRPSRWFGQQTSTNEVPADAGAEQERLPLQTGKVRKRGSAVPPGEAAHAARAQRATELLPEQALEALRSATEPARRELLRHPLYDAVNTLPRLRNFMAIHVYAVWDFMCLTKRLQSDFTSMGPLWLPPKCPGLARFINGLVLGEESDLAPDGTVASHLQLYLAAMDEVGASTRSMRRFLSLLEYGAELEVALSAAEAPMPARAFVLRTLAWARQGTTVEVLSTFLYGREDLIPAMFSRLLPCWQQSLAARNFAYYIERHIELDGDDHGPAAERALAELCGVDHEAWHAACRAAERAIRARCEFWDAVLATL